MTTTNERTTVRSILTKLAKRFHDGDDTREATELEAGTFRPNVGMAGNLRMTERHGKRFIVGRDLTAALGWPGFDDIDGTAIRLALITEAAELSLEPELRDTLEKCEELLASDFKAYLTANGINWESSADEPASKLPKNGADIPDDLIKPGVAADLVAKLTGGECSEDTIRRRMGDLLAAYLHDGKQHVSEAEVSEKAWLVKKNRSHRKKTHAK